MPGRDGTGPRGVGAMTGRGFGPCAGVNAPNYGVYCGRGFGRAYGRGFGLGFNANFGYNQPADKEVLRAQKDQLEKMIENINKRIEEM
ncbi:MAG: hypothetical protein FNP40_10580 [Dehalobacter sp. 4CP]|nr:hypothetical protein [Dehalobacter sp. 4CP]